MREALLRFGLLVEVQPLAPPRSPYGKMAPLLAKSAVG
jgi:hypothetical protein